MTRTRDDFELVRQLGARGMTQARIAAETGVPRPTVQRWLRRQEPPGRAASAGDWVVRDPIAYCYVLGMYLGDGHIDHRHPGGWTLHVSCDRRYPGIVREVAAAMEALFPPARARQRSLRDRALELVSISHPGIGPAFPQHGPGHKHTRRIILTAGQLALTGVHPGSLIRGLIQSDGCRCVNRVRTTLPSGRDAEYRYVRYFFTNYSADIREIFAVHCALLGIRVTAPNHRNLSVSHRQSVAILDRIVGPKA